MTQSLPHTAESLAEDLRELGVRAGDVLLLHSSARSVGYVAGGPQSIVQAILDVLGPGGTLVVPTHTPDNSDPGGWSNPPVPGSWQPVIRDHHPGFDPARTPSRWMGVLPETVRTWPGSLRSTHPHVSFAALGPHAAEITNGHDLADGFGEASPLGAVYRADGKVLLLGCGFDRNTSLHLAEARQDQPPQIKFGASVRGDDGNGHWITWTGTDTDTSDFTTLGAAYEATGEPSTGSIGSAPAVLMFQRGLVDFATDWMRANR
ncbi:AAC(3) family N-acetyltransferase [Winogradskya consettensis]|uniref:Aminoglycoside N(3)-acetyltransferase n=1 Tax=Winogradskya consettensis TaxID=113560 RepID=A0A919VL64_9ACTN|nr:AAC(3) family N-acetyltransferase [Actinoplanes consettensis]GIM67216.1 AAC(3) family N-acetyltransferase [Actinoplanes consettensis]